MSRPATGVSRAGVRTTTGPEAPYRIASLTKVVTSAALVRALGVPLDTPAVSLLPELAADWRCDRGITVAHLLAQVAGLREAVDASMVAALGEGPDALRKAARLVVRAGSDRAPGARWSYYNGNYFLAGAILAAVSGSPYEQAVDRFVLEPWGLAHTGFATPDYPRGRRPSGGLSSTVADLLTFGERLLADRPLLEQIRRPRTGPGDPTRYGLGWALGPSGQMYLNGRLPGYRAALLMLPDHEFVAVTLADDEQALPALARTLDDLQRPLTGDQLAEAVVSFAA